MSKVKPESGENRVVDIIKMKTIAKRKNLILEDYEIEDVRNGQDFIVIEPNGTTDHIPIETYHFPYGLWSPEVDSRSFDEANKILYASLGNFRALFE